MPYHTTGVLKFRDAHSYPVRVKGKGGIYKVTPYNVHEKIEVATAAVRLSIDARSQIHYMQVQADLFCVYNCCCLYNCNAMQWFEAKIRTGMC